MPKLKKDKNAELDIMICAKINEYCTLRQLRKKQVAANADMSVESLYQRMRKPENFKIGELRRIYDYLHVPQAERVGLGG